MVLSRSRTQRDDDEAALYKLVSEMVDKWQERQREEEDQAKEEQTAVPKVEDAMNPADGSILAAAMSGTL